MENLSDRHYIDKVLAGDTESFSGLVGRYSQKVFSLCVRITGNDEDARDVTQEIFLKVFDNLLRFRFRFESSFSTWLYRIAYNTAVSHVRKKGRDKLGGDPESVACEDAPHADVAADKEYDLRRLEHAISLLGPDDRTLLHLFYYEEMPVADIAAVTSLSAGNVKTRLHRIRNKLRTIYEKT